MDDEQLRRARRDFIRTHHPDLGGDPAAFVAGLAEFDDPQDLRPARTPRVHVIPDRGWPHRAARALTGLARRVGGRTPRAPRVR